MRFGQLLMISCLGSTALAGFWNLKLSVGFRKRKPKSIDHVLYNPNIRIPDEVVHDIFNDLFGWSGGKFEAVKTKGRDIILITSHEVADSEGDAARQVGELKTILASHNIPGPSGGEGGRSGSSSSARG